MAKSQWQKQLKKHDRRLLEGQSFGEEQKTDYPLGWYFARFSEDLAPGQVLPVEFMSHQFALFRGKSGRVGMVDSQCCHMGADLGRCGTVVEDRIKCGYHAWEFRTDGGCEVIPELDQSKIPPRAGQRSIPVREHAGNIWFWYGPEPAGEFIEVPYADSKKYLNLKGQIYIARGTLLPVAEHVSDIYHFPVAHKGAGRLEYSILVNKEDRLEYQLRPADETGMKKVQKWFRPFAFIEMIGPSASLYRTQKDATVDRSGPLLTIVLGGTPVRDDVMFFGYRVIVRKIGPGPLFAPFNHLIARMMWLTVRRNVYADIDVLRWLRHPEKTLWVKPDGPSVREFRTFFQRRIVPGWRFGDPMPEESAASA
ncbi:Rieske (2Fe-2S) protein [Candidatus Protofrankia californiensis]|uniref:Rieske (2Fe-2S) protein n=1 Tax=Candidatus Protofrankia californiensis TaxID=1839754 RepID=UPI0010418C52|nr:Rieske (2Fe-2S) protein [Candidatus Protofrankia californiensis]